MQVFKTFLILGSVFGAIGAAMAYVIMYHEYLDHYPDKKQPRKIALEAAIITFLIFFGLSAGFGYFLARLQG
jgi:H+/Cl- antiporter ClcA